jgi:copper chaperone CopZ
MLNAIFVDYDESKVDFAEIIETIKNVGYSNCVTNCNSRMH